MVGKIMLTQARLKELLHYDRKTGVFHWRVQRGIGIKAGSQAGCVNGAGYIVIHVDYVLYHAHRLAWLYVKGEWPNVIDHKNHTRNDNRWINLRNWDYSKNQMNRKQNKLTRGVHFQNDRWYVRIMRNGKRKRHGPYPTQIDALAASKKIGKALWKDLWT
jgi:hypothetical protein